jgi:leader peptidase (prepilin peptidase)/N-methyltransferase
VRLRRAVRSPPLQLAAALAALSGALASLVAAPGLDGMFGSGLALLMLGIALVDARYFLIPNPLTLAAAVLGLLRAAALAPEAAWLFVLIALGKGLAAALPFALLMLGYRRWRGQEGMGMGDIKLAAVAGVWLGWTTIFVAVEVAALSAIAAYFGRALLRRERYHRGALLPFGAFLAPAIWFGWLLEALAR